MFNAGICAQISYEPGVLDMNPNGAYDVSGGIRQSERTGDHDYCTISDEYDYVDDNNL